MTIRTETQLGAPPERQVRAVFAPFAAVRRLAHLKGVLLCARVPAALASLMVLAGLVTSEMSGVPYASLLRLYYVTSLVVCSLSVFTGMLVLISRFALEREPSPLKRLVRRAKSRGPYLLLPTVIVPIFLASFTATKSSIPYLVGFHWESFWANIDAAIFGEDAWRIAHAMLGDTHERAFELVYAVVWVTLLTFSFSIVALICRPRKVTIFYSAMFATWFVAGFVSAYAFSAAGPVFAHLTDPSLAARFAPLTSRLAAQLTPHGSVQITQEILERSLTQHMVVIGGGVSAMPSMHLAVAMIFVMATRKSHWRAVAVPFWLLIFILSAYFGYHYWIDGIVGSIIAMLCWLAAERLFEPARCAGPSYPVRLRRVLSFPKAQIAG